MATLDATPAKVGKNEIVVYQPNETVRLEVQLEDETVWLTQNQIGKLFGCTTRNVRMHLENIFSCGELDAVSTRKDFFLVRQEGNRSVSRCVTCYNLDAIISIGYRVNSVKGVQFRKWATGVLKEHMLRGYSLTMRLAQVEDRIDRQLSEHGGRIKQLEEKVDFFVQTSLPPVQGVFFDGQLWDACSFVEKLIAKAKNSILLVDNWIDGGTLDMLAKKRKGVKATIVATKRGDKCEASDFKKFNAQYPELKIRHSDKFHDRFIVLDDKEVYLIGASLKDLGKKCFGFTKLDANVIPLLKSRI